MTQEEAIKIAESCKVIVGDGLESPSLHIILTSEAKLVNMGINRVIDALRIGKPWKAMTPADITAARQLMGWTQKQLAAYLKTTARSVRAWEAGINPPPGSVEVALSYLLREMQKTEEMQR